VNKTAKIAADQTKSVGSPTDIGSAMYTEYLLPVEIVGILLLMGIVGAMIMSRRLREPRIELASEKTEEK
jgi:NADH:ubiquinone oxidoreductase subunit 6 (subunit J)